MLELIFVIVVMGILGKFGVEFLARSYESFIFSKINNELQAKSESAVELISKRLEYRIKKSVIARNLTTGEFNYINDTGLSDPNATVMEWISMDIDGFRGDSTPFWSGLIDLNASTSATLISPGTNLNNENTLIQILSYGNTDINNTAIYLIDTNIYPNPWGYDANITFAGGIFTVSGLASDGGNPFINDQNSTLHPIQTDANVTHLIPRFANIHTDVSEYYKLAWTANAIILEDYNDSTNIGDLYFYYDYQPWQGETFLNGKRVLLAEDINTFRFRSAGSLIKIQVCAKSDLLVGEEYALCKEKTVY